MGGSIMRLRTILAACAAVAVLMPAAAHAAIKPFPASFAVREVPVDGATIHVATDVKSVVNENSGHWLMEEQPAAAMAAMRAFLKG